jgi:hypothetical protein
VLAQDMMGDVNNATEKDGIFMVKVEKSKNYKLASILAGD